MLNLALQIAIGMVSVAMLLNLWRLLLGPESADRILALETMYLNSMALIILFGLWQGAALFFEAALLVAMLGFASTAALCKFLLRGDIIE
ncbi:Multisubunit Na+/H+ antiporter, MnhF subunit [Hahella chejuensis KCTC 2396]|uniref:Multisubunit Na+/H+ antiporter, MnhF subunit n=1 Tax=Hahella chejuensis (strain KCTC 2396) TaxID=349521 RepID=Q2SNS9_HAHCH|nr:K+/H+ antiporter subunit F [Hahella chejuensis]ABC27695.1 Multisubunit Na+/H+ antiporter, MnhF subunit [Hahella chejuensis KCTC 2396]